MSDKKRSRFPFFVDITDWQVLVVGGGSIALRRTGVLKSFGAEITLVCPHADSQLMTMAERGEICWLKEPFCDRLLDEQKWKLVLAITDDEEVNHRITAAARARGILTNNASDQTDCDFFFPAIIEGNGMTIGLVSDGSDHSYVRRIAAKIREEYGE